MSYLLGGVVLPNPQEYKRDQIEIGSTIVTLNGTIKKDIVARRERHLLTFRRVSQTDIATIMSIWNEEVTKTFQVTESNLTVGPVTVHVNVPTREYNTRGGEYREDISLILDEVS